MAPKKTGIICSSRRITYRPMGGSGGWLREEGWLRVAVGCGEDVRPGGAGVRGPGRTPPTCYDVS
ncbi:hypothetical protein GCM10018791_68840 [Streptomyces zaomyceticus]|nr:hypothetical protein GCM10018791_68840 [Streptomyces zaomyceticus]